MEKERRDTIVVGLFVLAAAGLVLWAVFYLQGLIRHGDQVTYSARFEHVGTLMLGDEVTLSGVPVGRVQAIALEGRRARVDFLVERSLAIPRGTAAVIESADLFGQAALELRWGAGEPIAPGDTLIGELAPGIRDLITHGVLVVERSLVVLEEVQGFVAGLDSLLGPESNLPSTLANIEEFTANARDLSRRFEGYGGRLDQTLTAVDSAALGLSGLVRNNSRSVETTLARLNELSIRLDSLTIELESGQGTLGKLLHDERLYHDLRRTTLEAQGLIKDIREHPEHFIRLKLF